MTKESEIVFEDSDLRWAKRILSDIKEFVNDADNFKIYCSGSTIRIIRNWVSSLFHSNLGMTITRDKITVHHYEYFEKTAVKIAKEFNIPKIVRDYW